MIKGTIRVIKDNSCATPYCLLIVHRLICEIEDNAIKRGCCQNVKCCQCLDEACKDHCSCKTKDHICSICNKASPTLRCEACDALLCDDCFVIANNHVICNKTECTEAIYKEKGY